MNSSFAIKIPSREPGTRRAALAVLALLLASPSQAADVTPDGLSVSVRSARRLCFSDRVEVTGVLLPRQEVDVAAEREGFKVAQILVAPLEMVAAGQVLATLAPIEGIASPGASPVLRASVAGMVLRSNAQVGVPVSPRQGALFQIAARRETDLQAAVPLGDLAKLRPGQKVSVKPLGLTESVGTVSRVDQTLDPASQLGRVRIGLEPSLDMRFGTFARGIITLNERCGLGVPYAAILYEPEGTVVHTIAGDRVVTRQVETGLLAGSDVEIRSGLTEADTVVVRAGAFLREGDRVYPVPVREGPDIREIGQAR
ncbi:HlyD family efflux transporter periplasmic adaptor subunit [Methylobacterium sp. J-078]|uniref:efflux RND transporter periplasmic adaptor subunit n=1 Tax=Methylobacterium sp. J-078 TaxID=2836657 RepID=UPI001FB9F6A9|nr:HlyD family efflux transporter periplasmic adaptor subunit [Methylobacterium sp. J-078]MCJ2043884.1 HlyD family efflux transporter periplasmic adaptor subunit [Methylobacterium sp. J-078]